MFLKEITIIEVKMNNNKKKVWAYTRDNFTAVRKINEKKVDSNILQ